MKIIEKTINLIFTLLIIKCYKCIFEKKTKKKKKMYEQIK